MTPDELAKRDMMIDAAWVEALIWAHNQNWCMGGCGLRSAIRAEIVRRTEETASQKVGKAKGQGTDA